MDGHFITLKFVTEQPRSTDELMLVDHFDIIPALSYELEDNQTVIAMEIEDHSEAAILKAIGITWDALETIDIDEVRFLSAWLDSGGVSINILDKVIEIDAVRQSLVDDF